MGCLGPQLALGINCLKMRSRLIKALNNRFYVKFMQLEIGLLRMTKHPSRKAMNFRHLLGCDTIVTRSEKGTRFRDRIVQLSYQDEIHRSCPMHAPENHRSYPAQFFSRKNKSRMPICYANFRSNKTAHIWVVLLQCWAKHRMM